MISPIKSVRKQKTPLKDVHKAPELENILSSEEYKESVSHAFGSNIFIPNRLMFCFECNIIWRNWYLVADVVEWSPAWIMLSFFIIRHYDILKFYFRTKIAFIMVNNNNFNSNWHDLNKRVSLYLND